jgi:hypothetical protein
MGLALLVDTTSIYAYHQSLKEGKVAPQGNINYAALLDALNSAVSPSKVGDVTFDPMFAFVAINPEHEGQQKFCYYLRHQLGFFVDETDFRDAFVVPDKEIRYQRLSTRLAYVTGLLARNRPHILAVTDAFDVYYPLLDYVEHRGGTATLAFFRRGLEERWQRVGVFDEDSRIGFFDLTSHAKKILGVDLGVSSGKVNRRGGLGEFSF